MPDAAAAWASLHTTHCAENHRNREPDGAPPIVPGLWERAFERLMVDVLNEERHAAHLARLAEDYLEKTDVRYLARTHIGRPNGARIQVLLLTNPDLYKEKIAGIGNPEHFVLLSPIDLAHWVNAEMQGQRSFIEPLDQALLARLLPALGHPRTVPELADAFGQIFERALQHRLADARGPMAAVCPACRTHPPSPTFHLPSKIILVIYQRLL